MSTSSSTYNQTLTQYAYGVAQDTKSALADFIAPRVSVATSTGKYKKFNSREAFAALDTSRSIGSASKRIDFSASDGSYNCNPQSLEIAIDDQERALAGLSEPLALEESKVKTLVTSAIVSHEQKVFSTITSSVTSTASKGEWSSADNDPISEIDEQIEAIIKSTGMMPNRLVFGLAAWRTFRNHKKVLARQPGAEQAALNYPSASSLFLNPKIEIQVGVLSYDTSTKAAVATKSNIVGSAVYIFYSSSNPTYYDPSFAKTFSIGCEGLGQVTQYRDESVQSDIFRVSWGVDTQVVSTELVRRLAIS